MGICLSKNKCDQEMAQPQITSQPMVPGAYKSPKSNLLKKIVGPDLGLNCLQDNRQKILLSKDLRVVYAV